MGEEKSSRGDASRVRADAELAVEKAAGERRAAAGERREERRGLERARMGEVVADWTADWMTAGMVTLGVSSRALVGTESIILTREEKYEEEEEEDIWLIVS